MGNIHLVTGYAGKDHIIAEDQGAMNSNIFGNGQFVFDKGNKLAALAVSNNLVRISDGQIYMQGRFIRLNANDHIDLTIENGNQDFQRIDLIVARYTKDSEFAVEDCNLVVLKGTPATSNPADPEYITGDVLNGYAIQHDMPLYRVKLDGLAIAAVERVFEYGTLVDATLSKEGRAADAKTVGDALGAIAEALDTINGEVI